MTLMYNDLQDLVLPKLSIDEFSPKTGNNQDVIVLGFYVKDQEPAKDLSHFIENGPYNILDVEASPSTNEDGDYMVFVEVKRNEEFFDFTEKLLNDLDRVVEDINWEYKPYYSDETYKNSSEWRSWVITDPSKYVSKEEFKEQKIQQEKQDFTNNIGNFFVESLLSNLSLDDNFIKFSNRHKSFTFEIVNFGDSVLEEFANEPSIERTPDDIYLGRMLGNVYNIDTFGAQRLAISSPKSDKILLLKRT